MELVAKGNKGLFVMRKSSRMCSVATISLRLAVLNGFEGRFGHHIHGHIAWFYGEFPPPLRTFSGGTISYDIATHAQGHRMWL